MLTASFSTKTCRMELIDGHSPPSSTFPTKRTRVGLNNLEKILRIGREAMHRTKDGSKDICKTSSTEDRRFREMFGCSVVVADALWTRLEEDGSLPSRKIEDMMCALHFLKSYAKEGTGSVMVGTIDERTYRK